MSDVPPKIISRLQEMANKIQPEIVFTNEGRDGRNNSSKDEEQILKLLIKYFESEIIIPQEIRTFYDFILIFEGDKHPVNIKITTSKGSDNSASYMALEWALTDNKIDINRKNNKNISIKILRKYFEENKCCTISRDYYFMVFNKKNKNIIINSIRGLTKLTSNPSNRPFQINWSKNTKYKYNSTEEIVEKIKNALNTEPTEEERFIEWIRRDRQNRNLTTVDVQS